MVEEAQAGEGCCHLGGGDGGAGPLMQGQLEGLGGPS